MQWYVGVASYLTKVYYYVACDNIIKNKLFETKTGHLAQNYFIHIENKVDLRCDRNNYI